MSFIKEHFGKIIGFLFLLSSILTIAFDLLQFEGPAVSASHLTVFASMSIGFIYIIQQNQMIGYVSKRLFEAGLTVFAIATVTFLLLRFLPGGPFDRDKALPPEVMANINAKYHLDKPMLEQYGIYIGNLLQGDLGESYKFIGRGVTEIIAESLPNSFKLGFYALLISFILGIPLGLYAASKHNTLSDNLAMFFSISGVALPSFLVAAVLIVIFSFGLGWFPPALWNSPIHYVLPVVCLGIRPIGIIARLTRSSVLDVIRSDFIRTARAKGLAEQVVLYKHVLRNSLIPVLTMSGPLVAGLLSGSFVIEIIFAVPGMGKHFVQSVTNRDYPLILGLTLLYAVMLIAANLIVDLLYAVIDPRIKLT